MTTTEFYPAVLAEQKRSQSIRNLINDQDWLIDQIIIPKLPSFIYTVKSIIYYLILDKSFKLPITSNSNDFLKGIITRRSFKIVNLSLQINKLSFFNNSNLFKIQLNDDAELELTQLKLVLQYLLFLSLQIHNLIEFIKLFKSQQQEGQNVYVRLKHNLIFLKKLNQFFQNITTVNELIDNPIQSTLFPRSHLDSQLFNPTLNLDKMSIDLYLNSGEIFIELIFLKKILAKPWCFINKNGVSFNEFVTKKFVQEKNGTQNINQVIEYYLNEKNWPKFWSYEEKPNNSSFFDLTSLNKEDATAINSNMTNPSKSHFLYPHHHYQHQLSNSAHDSSDNETSSIKSLTAEDHHQYLQKQSSGTTDHRWFNKLINFQYSSETTNQLYLNRNIKFNNSIYWILKNLQVKISDPILIIVNIKLHSTKNLIQNNLINLKNLIINLDFLQSVINKEVCDNQENDNAYNELVNQLFNNENQDLIDMETDFDLVSFLQADQETELNKVTESRQMTLLSTSKLSGTLNMSYRSSYEDLENLDVSFDILKNIQVDYNALNKRLEDWDNELIKDVSLLINSDASSGSAAIDNSSCCEFDVFGI